MFELARAYRDRGMSAYSTLQQQEFAHESIGYRATAHQRFVGTGYFDEVQQVIAGGEVCTSALHGSTEEEQFTSAATPVSPLPILAPPAVSHDCACVGAAGGSDRMHSLAEHEFRHHEIAGMGGIPSQHV
jgi:hypothetical protein